MRSRFVTRTAVAMLAMLAMLGATVPIVAAAVAAATSCGDTLPAKGRQRAEGIDYTVVFTPSRWPIPVGQHFSVHLEVCPATGKPLPTALHIDAEMPQHKHGMNYRASVKSLGKGQFQAEGLMFHMPGQWRFNLALNTTPAPTRLHRDVDVQ
jgi:YtkA-like